MLALVMLAACGNASETSSRSEKLPAEATDLPQTELSVTTESDRTVRTKTFKVQGTSNPGALVEVDGDSTTVGDDGRWTVEVSLKLGENILRIDAIKAAQEPAPAKQLQATRRRSPTELSALRARRQVAAERRARQKAKAEAERARKKAAAAKPDYDNPSFKDINSMLTGYLNEVLADPASANPDAVASDFANAADKASPACAAALKATALALLDQTGGADAIRERVLNASFEATSDCT